MNPYYLSVVIPAYNEELRLPRALSSTIKYLDAQQYTSEIVVVTDGSTDATAQMARSYAAQFPDLRVLDFPRNRGKGFAVKEGMLAANGKHRLFMDADYAVPIEEVSVLLAKMKSNYDIVIGSRAAEGANVEVSQGFPRQQLANAFGLLQKAVLQLPFADTQCGFKLFSADAAETFFPMLAFECAYFDAELLYVAHNMGAKVADVGVTWRHDQETRLPIGPKRTIDLLNKLFSIRRIHARNIANGLRNELERVC
jgi:glycosyltransferase involved in cell wall biosynthesis